MNINGSDTRVVTVVCAEGTKYWRCKKFMYNKISCLTGVHIVLAKKENNQACLMSEGYIFLLGDMV